MRYSFLEKFVNLEKLANKVWYQKHPLASILSPLGSLFCGFASLRKAYYQRRQARTKRPHFSVLIIVVGNITVGGTGKTPFVIYLAETLKAAGYRPGIISRGYGGKAKQYPFFVTSDTSPLSSGDEPWLIANRTACPVVVDPNRVNAAQYLLEQSDCDIIISDDGLQHYSLPRDIEIVMVDGERGFGNGHCLPAGPLREPLSRLESVDFVITKGVKLPYISDHKYNHFVMNLECSSLKAINPWGKETGHIKQNDYSKCHAVAGIANPDLFFNRLQSLGFSVIPHAFPDHYLFTAHDIEFGDNLPVIMTEKDAVKCRQFARAHHYYLPVTAEVEGDFVKQLFQLLTGHSRTGKGGNC